ncbi:MAG: hypothetical protein U0Q12_00600 [Vicinamibacterales bacterium]
MREHLRDLYIVEITRLRDEVRGGRASLGGRSPDAVITLRKRTGSYRSRSSIGAASDFSPAGPRRALEAPLDPDDAGCTKGFVLRVQAHVGQRLRAETSRRGARGIRPHGEALQDTQS